MIIVFLHLVVPDELYDLAIRWMTRPSKHHDMALDYDATFEIAARKPQCSICNEDKILPISRVINDF